MSTERFSILYDGPALVGHEIDVRIIVPALLALSDLFEEANNILNMNRAKISLNIRGSFKSGGFGFDVSVSQNILQSILDLAASEKVQSAAAIITLLGFGTVKDGVIGLVHLLKMLRGRAVTRIETKERAAIMYVEEEMIEVDNNVVKLYRNKRTRKSLSDGVSEPLFHDGIESFTVLSINGTDLCRVGKDESAYLHAPKRSLYDIEIVERNATIQIIGISFEDKHKWRFSSGAEGFYAEINDQLFLQRVNSGEESFVKGDLLDVILRERNFLDSSGVLRSDKSISKIISHRRLIQDKLTDLLR